MYKWHSEIIEQEETQDKETHIVDEDLHALCDSMDMEGHEDMDREEMMQHIIANKCQKEFEMMSEETNEAAETDGKWITTKNGSKLFIKGGDGTGKSSNFKAKSQEFDNKNAAMKKALSSKDYAEYKFKQMLKGGK